MKREPAARLDPEGVGRRRDGTHMTRQKRNGTPAERRAAGLRSLRGETVEEHAARRSVLDLIDAAHQTVRLLEQVVGGDTGDARQVRWVLGGEIGQQLRSATDRALLCWVRQSSAAESRRA